MTPLTIRFPPPQYEWLRAQAARLDVSIGEMVRLLVWEAQERRGERERAG